MKGVFGCACHGRGWKSKLRRPHGRTGSRAAIEIELTDKMSLQSDLWRIDRIYLVRRLLELVHIV